MPAVVEIERDREKGEDVGGREREGGCWTERRCCTTQRTAVRGLRAQGQSTGKSRNGEARGKAVEWRVVSSL